MALEMKRGEIVQVVACAIMMKAFVYVFQVFLETRVNIKILYFNEGGYVCVINIINCKKFCVPDLLVFQEPPI
jgi:hypothetical protein